MRSRSHQGGRNIKQGVTMITESEIITHPALPGVTIRPLDGELKAGMRQQILVQVEPGVEIPLHRHDVDASMFVVAGSAKVLASDPGMNDRAVSIGSCVFFERLRDHGFVAGPDGLSFISTNDGIVDTDPEHWDIDFSVQTGGQPN